MSKQATTTTITEDFTLTPREYIGTIQYWNGTYEIDAREYELLQYSGHKIDLYPPINPQPLAQGPAMLGIDHNHEK